MPGPGRTLLHGGPFAANNVGESYRTERDRREDLSLHLSAADAERDRAISTAVRWEERANLLERSLDATFAQVQRVTALCDRFDCDCGCDYGDAALQFRRVLAGEGSEQLPAKPRDLELEVANQNLRTLEKTVANLKSGLRVEQAARERAIALCDEYEGVNGTDYDDLARKIRADLDVRGPQDGDPQ